MRKLWKPESDEHSIDAWWAFPSAAQVLDGFNLPDMTLTDFELYVSTSRFMFLHHAHLVYAMCLLYACSYSLKT